MNRLLAGTAVAVLGCMMTVGVAGHVGAEEYRNIYTLERFEAALLDQRCDTEKCHGEVGIQVVHGGNRKIIYGA